MGILKHFKARLLIATWLSLLIASLAVAFPTTNVLDDFDTGGDQDKIAGNWSNDIDGGTGGCARSSGTLVLSVNGIGGCWWNASTFGADQEIFFTVPDHDNHAFAPLTFRAYVCLRGGVGTPNVDGYGFRIRNKDGATDDVIVFKMINGAFSDLGSFFEQEISSGDKLGMSHMSNGDMEIWYNGGSGWTSLGTTNNTDYDCANTNIGLLMSHNTYVVDVFGGGDVVSITETVTFMPAIAQ